MMWQAKGTMTGLLALALAPLSAAATDAAATVDAAGPEEPPVLPPPLPLPAASLAPLLPLPEVLPLAGCTLGLLLLLLAGALSKGNSTCRRAFGSPTESQLTHPHPNANEQ